MNPAPILILAVVASAATAFAIVELTKPPQPEVHNSTPTNSESVKEKDAPSLGKDLLARIEKLESQAGRVSAPVVDQKLIEQAVADWMAKHGEATGRAADASAPGAKKKDPKAVFDEARAVLEDRRSSRDDREAALKRLKEAGQLDQMIALLEQRAQESPGDADLQTHLGQAYLQRLFGAPDDEKGDFANKADQAFDAALKANPEHWEARFSKAISLSFWPAFLGKQKIAIENFETLIQQQERSGLRNEEYTHTYVILGNLYEQTNKPDKALEIRKKGAQLFPANEDLRASVGDGGRK